MAEFSIEFKREHSRPKEIFGWGHTEEEEKCFESGESWGYVIRRVCPCCGAPGRMVDSCWGFYTDSLEPYILEHVYNGAVCKTSLPLENVKAAWSRRHE